MTWPTALYTDDSQSGWAALDPELAYQDDEEGGRMTKKSLAFLGSLDETGNYPWWKDDDRAEEFRQLRSFAESRRKDIEDFFQLAP